MVLALELGHDVAHILAAVGIGDQQGVGGVDDDQVAHAHHAQYPPGRVDVAVVDVMQNRFAIDLIALGIAGGELAQDFPGADIAPADIAGHHGHLRGLLHQRHVDGQVRRAAEAIGIQFALARGCILQALAVRQRGLGGRQHLRGVGGQLVHQGAGLEAEYAGVPQVLAAVEVALGGGQVGFFDEAFDPVTRGSAPRLVRCSRSRFPGGRAGCRRSPGSRLRPGRGPGVTASANALH